METTEQCVRWGGLVELGTDLREYLERRCRDGSELDDIVQESLLKAALFRTSLQDSARLRAWVFRIARNLLRDARRREGRIPCADLGTDPFESIEGREPAPGHVGETLRPPGARDAFDRVDLLRGLESGFWSLSGGDQRLLRSYYAGAMSCAETALECDIPRPLVKVRLFRARRRLRNALLRGADSDRQRFLEPECSLDGAH